MFSFGHTLYTLFLCLFSSAQSQTRRIRMCRCTFCASVSCCCCCYWCCLCRCKPNSVKVSGRKRKREFLLVKDYRHWAPVPPNTYIPKSTDRDKETVSSSSCSCSECVCVCVHCVGSRGVILVYEAYIDTPTTAFLYRVREWEREMSLSLLLCIPSHFISD